MVAVWLSFKVIRTKLANVKAHGCRTSKENVTFPMIRYSCVLASFTLNA